MKKLKLIFAALLSAMCFATVQATVTITAPTVPEQLKSIVSGQEYYLYNVDACRFVNFRTYNYYNEFCLRQEGVSFIVEKRDDGNYRFCRNDGTTPKYVECWENFVYWGYTTDKDISYAGFNIVKDGNAYKIQNIAANDQYYGADCWWGMRDNDYDNVYYNGTANTTWLFIPENSEEGKKYPSKLQLYNAIVAADAKGFHVERYEDIYNDETKTNEELNAAANELNNGSSLSETHSYLFPEWSDYPILITSLGNWSRYYSENYLWRETYSGDKGTTNTLKVSVYVDQPSTLTFIMDCNQRWQNEPTMPFQVFVDGELTYDYKGETNSYYYDTRFDVLHNYRDSYDYDPYREYYNYNIYNIAYNRHFVNLEPGHHLVDIITTQNYDGDYFDTHFYQIGVEKTPTIEVNLANEGSLGYEALKAIDNNPLIAEPNIRNVRRLKISGKMGDADWEELYNMTQLTALDLTDAQITEIKTGQLSQYYHESLQYLHDLKLPKTLKTIGQEAFYGTYIDSVDIPESVTSIGDFAFSNTRLREANIPNATSIGHNAFRGCTMLNKVVMKNVEWMGINAFAECYNLKDVEFEGTLTTVPQRAFYWCDEIENISIPETVTKIEISAFDQNNKSTISKLPKGLQTLENWAFMANYNATFSLPEGLKTIGAHALQSADRLVGDIPSSVTYIGEEGMRYAWWVSSEDTIHIPAHASFGKSAFQNAHMKNVVIPENINNITTSLMFANCDSLRSFKLLSSTKISVPADFVDGLNKKNIKVYVPDYLKYTYMRDSYWMDFTIETFPTTEMDSIVVRQNLALSQHDRFEGVPGLAIEKGVQFELEGAAGMDLKNITLSSDLEANNYSQIVSGTDQVSVNGLASERLYTKANKWYFISLPFDCKLSQTVNENDGKYAIRYYDGASRTTSYRYPESAHNYSDGMNKETVGNLQTFSFPGATMLKLVFNSRTRTEGNYDYIHVLDAAGQDHTFSGEIGNRELVIEGNHFDIWITSDGGSTYYGYSFDAIYADGIYINNTNGDNWKNYDCTKDIIPAGTGFIFMTSQDSWTRFYSVDNGTKNRIFEDSENENNEFHYELQKHPSEDAANRGWNLVGNPYPNYYNNHKISFAAPITLWDGTTYKAYSLRDDDIAIKPNQAIFVQCPEDVAEISFPAAGRQTTAVITDQANAHVRGEMNNVRQIVDLSLTNGTYTDDTRVVINPEASLCYEVGCDAGKFMSMDAAVQQLYTLDATNNRYAINERPLAEGRVVLGISIPAEGTYTFSLKRNQAETVLLIDNETGFTHDLTADDYTFTAKAGANDGRFVLNIIAPEVTGVEEVESNDAASHDDMYTVGGIRVNSAAKSGVYIKRNGKNVTKVVVK